MRRLRRLGMRLIVLVVATLLLCPAAAPPRPTVAASADFSKIVREVPVTEPLMALTFDDGPDPVYTPQLLAVLAQHHARATFFVTGIQAERLPDLLRAEAMQGHQIGNHGYSHRDLHALAPDIIRDEVNRAAAVITANVGKTPTVFRPPLGKFAPRMLETVQALGYRVVLWTWATNSEDSLNNPPAAKIAGHILKGAKPGAIVLLHDHGGDRRHTVAAVAQVLEKLSAQGYRFVTLDELMQDHYRAPNK